MLGKNKWFLLNFSYADWYAQILIRTCGPVQAVGKRIGASVIRSQSWRRARNTAWNLWNIEELLQDQKRRKKSYFLHQQNNISVGLCWVYDFKHLVELWVLVPKFVFWKFFIGLLWVSGLNCQRWSSCSVKKVFPSGSCIFMSCIDCMCEFILVHSGCGFLSK